MSSLVISRRDPALHAGVDYMLMLTTRTSTTIICSGSVSYAECPALPLSACAQNQRKHKGKLMSCVLIASDWMPCKELFQTAVLAMQHDNTTHEQLMSQVEVTGACAADVGHVNALFWAECSLRKLSKGQC